MITQIRGKIADASNPTADKSAIAKDIQAIADEILSAFGSTKFNETSLLQSVEGGAGSGFTFQTGVTSSDSIDINYTSELVGTSSTTAWGDNDAFEVNDYSDLEDYWDESANLGNGAYVDENGWWILQDQSGDWFTFQPKTQSRDWNGGYEYWQGQFANLEIEDFGYIEGTDWNYFEASNNSNNSSDSGDVSGLSSSVASVLDSLKTVTSSTISNLSIDGLEDAVDTSLGSIGNFTQRLNAKQDFLSSAILNSQSAYSRLFDADVALESLNATKSQIGAQAASAMFSQLNFAPQQVLQLFG
jgi:flagellin-like hook-associated protein FlgL